MRMLAGFNAIRIPRIVWWTPTSSPLATSMLKCNTPKITVLARRYSLDEAEWSNRSPFRWGTAPAKVNFDTTYPQQPDCAPKPPKSLRSYCSSLKNSSLFTRMCLLRCWVACIWRWRILLVMTERYDFLFKFIVIGDTAVGKSCLLHRFIDNKCMCTNLSYAQLMY